MRKAAGPPAHTLKSVDHALQLLSLFGERHRLRNAEVVNLLGVSPSTASRLVSMLEFHGFVQKDEATRGYVVGSRLRAIGFTAVEEFDLRPQVRPSLEVLAAETGETAQFGTIQGTTSVFLDCIEGRHHLRVTSRVGLLFPAHTTSTGKTMLAALPLDELLERYPHERLARLTRRTLTSRTRLFSLLDAVRRSTIAISLGESEDGIYSVAVPVVDALGRTRGALSVAAPETRTSERSAALMKRILRRETAALSARLR